MQQAMSTGQPDQQREGLRNLWMSSHIWSSRRSMSSTIASFFFVCKFVVRQLTTACVAHRWVLCEEKWDNAIKCFLNEEPIWCATGDAWCFV